MLNRSCSGYYGRTKGDLTTKAFTLIATGNALQDQNLAKLTSINGNKKEPKHFLKE